MTPHTKIELLLMLVGLAGMVLVVVLDFTYFHVFTKNPEDDEVTEE